MKEHEDKTIEKIKTEQLDKRIRLDNHELELTITGLLFLIESIDNDKICDEALMLAERLCMGRRGKPGGKHSRKSTMLWKKALQRVETKIW